MPKKHEKEDRKFIKDFAKQLNEHYRIAKNSGLTDEAFADSLDVTRPALQDYLDGEALPTIRTLALAVDRYGIDMGYDGTEFRAARRAALAPTASEQLSFPFLLVSPNPRLAVRVGAVTESTVTLGLQIKRAV